MGIDLALSPARPPDGSAATLFGGHMKKAMWSFACVLALAGATGCAQTAKGVVQDTKENTSAVRGGVETVDVKTAIIADKEIDSGAIDVDTFQDKKLVVLRGSVPTEAQKQKAEAIARDHAKSYRIENQLAVVPK
jgi:hyperosmotically inducible periplasmic protein